MNKQLKIGFGVGCGLLVVIFLLIVGSATYWATQTGRDFKVVIKAENKLNKQYGVLGAYVPENSGLPCEERIEKFIQIRKSLVEYHAGMEIALEDYIAQQENSGEGLMAAVNSVRAGSQLGPAYALFWLSRNEKLLEYGMGAGEYAYIYCLAYYGYLNHDPADGVTGLDGFSINSEPNVKIHIELDTEQEFSAFEKAQSRISEMMLGFLEKIEISGSDNTVPELMIWQEELQAEIVSLQSNQFKIPFTGNGDEVLAGVFEKFRVDLESYYVARVNPLELFFQQEKVEPQKN